MQDRVKAVEHLEQAETRIRNSEEVIASQKAQITELERDGLDSQMARSLLTEFEQIQSVYIFDRDRLRVELAQIDATSVGRLEM
jgi:hypothetical protein